MPLPPGLDCCCDEGPTPCPAPARCGWWPELCCDTDEGEEFRDCWPATGKTFGPGSTVVIDLTVIAACKALNIYRCETPAAIATPGVYDQSAVDCSPSLPRNPTGAEVAVAWHARKRVVQLTALSLQWAPSSGCTGFGFRAKRNISVALAGTIAESGPPDSWDACGQVSLFSDCSLATQVVYCDLYFTPLLRGGWYLRITPVSGTFPVPHELPMGFTPFGGSGSSLATPATGYTKYLTSLDGYPNGGLEISVAPEGCLWSWGGDTSLGRLVFGTATESGNQPSGITPPNIPSGLVESQSGTAWSRVRTTDINWRITRSLAADRMCGYDCDHLPSICDEPSSYMVTIEREIIGGVVCEGGGRQCLVSCTTTGLLSWCAESLQWHFEILGESGSSDGEGCFTLEGGDLVPIESGCEVLSAPGLSVGCQRDPTDLVAGEWGWAIGGGWSTPLVAGSAALIPFVPFSAGVAPTGTWEITDEAEIWDSDCLVSEPVLQFARLTIE